MQHDPRHACVVGAGLAGAAVAAHLVRRGWTVQLLSAGDRPADGASALPVGMLSPHVTRSPTPLSRLTALGVPRMRAELERLLPPGRGWWPTEVDNHGHDPGRHPATLVRPGALVQAWIDEARASGRLSLRLGARLGDAPGSSACWAPVSVHPRRDGSTAVFPHFVLDRAKPGTLVVDPQGRRFLDESSSYHRFGEAMLAHAPAGGEAAAWLLADREAVQRYGLGLVRPGARGLRRYVREGHVLRARTLPELARAMGVPADALVRSVARFNALADAGLDSDHGRGRTPYQRHLGDPAVVPNPSLRALREGPFHALRLQVGDIAGSRGLLTDAAARVLGPDGPIPGLHAVGNDMQSVMGSHYPGPGINLGPAIVFAHAAALALRRGTPDPLETP